MNTQTVTSTTVKLNLNSGILENAQTEANRIGISLQDFIRMLLGTYFANSKSLGAISRDQELLSNAKEDIKRKEYSKVNASQLNAYLDSL